MRAAAWAVAFAAAVLSPGAALAVSPYLQNVGADRATVLWLAPEAGSGSVEYSADGLVWHAVNAARRVLTFHSGALRHQYLAELRGLLPGQTYLYRVLLDGQILYNQLRFRTAERGAFTFLVFGDSGTGSEAQAGLAKRMFEEPDVALVLNTGDLSQDDGSLDRMEAHYLRVYAPLMKRVPFFPTLGNHDYGSDMAAPYLALHVLPASGTPEADAGRYYSFDWGDVHFVSLDSNLLIHPAMARRMLDWLERDLQRTGQFWKVAFFHHPPYPTGHHREDPLCAQVRAEILPVLERHGVQVTFSGHEHAYERTKPLRNGETTFPGKGMVSFITGGGGADLHLVGPAPWVAHAESVHHYLRVRVQGWRLEITAVALDGRIVDQTTLAPAPEILPGGVVNAGSFTAELGPGSLISIFGRHLAVEERSAPGLPLPGELAGATVSLNGEPAPVLFVSPHQINAQLPYEREGQFTLRVSTPNAPAEIPVRLARAAPAILSLGRGSQRAPAVLRQLTGSLVTGQSPAAPGDTLVIFAVGLGAVAGGIHAGHPAPSGPLLLTRDPVQVWVGERVLTPSFAGLAPGFAGLYQINLRLPDDLTAGAYPMRIGVAGASSPPVCLFVEGDSRGDPSADDATPR